MCYWIVVSLIAWGVLSLTGIYWRPFHAPPAACVLAMGIGCVANWFKNRSFHCAITAPLFLIAGVALLLASVGVIHLNILLVWPFLLIGVAIAFYLNGDMRSAPHLNEYSPRDLNQSRRSS
jgi:hypothetical protein